MTMEQKIRITELTNTGDTRGFNSSLPTDALAFVGRMSDVYLAALKPGAIRGNHFHLRRREAIVILPGSKWSFHWDEGEGSPAQHRNYDGSRAILVLVSPAASHAVRNDGQSDIYFVAISSEPYDPSESVSRKVL